MAPVSSGSTSTAAPAVTSGSEVVLAATTGTLDAKASTTGMPNPSYSEGKANTAAPAYTWRSRAGSSSRFSHTTAAPLRAGTVYTATGDATSAAGVAMTTPRTWTFTTIDTEPPTVGSVTPPDGATDAAPGTRVSAVFEGGIEPGSALFTLTNRTTGATVAGSTTYDAATRTATFTPAADLAKLTGYTASVSARNTAGLGMAAPHTWQFTTDDGPPR